MDKQLDWDIIEEEAPKMGGRVWLNDLRHVILNHGAGRVDLENIQGDFAIVTDGIKHVRVPTRAIVAAVNPYTEILDEVKKGNPILVAQDLHKDLPTIHNFAGKYRNSIEHLGFGFFEGKTEHGKFSFDGGSAMFHSGNISWTYLRVDDAVWRDLHYDISRVEKALLELAADVKVASRTAARISDPLRTCRGCGQWVQNEFDFVHNGLMCEKCWKAYKTHPESFKKGSSPLRGRPDYGEIEGEIEKRMRGAGIYGPYTPDHVKQGPPRIEHKDGTVLVEFSGNDAITPSLIKKLDDLAGTDDWLLYAEVSWKGVTENSLETGYSNDSFVSNYRILDAWMEIESRKIQVPRELWRELNEGKLEEALNEAYVGGNMPREISANMKTADDREVTEWAKNLADNYKSGSGPGFKRQLMDAAKELGLNALEVDARYQFATDTDMRSPKGIYFLLTGQAARGGYSFASSKTAGSSSTPRYVVSVNKYQVYPGRFRQTNGAWRSEYGRPTPQNIQRYVEKFNESLEDSGVNSHIGRGSAIYGAEIIDQMSGEVVAEWQDRSIIAYYKNSRINGKPMFEVVSKQLVKIAKGLLAMDEAEAHSTFEDLAGGPSMAFRLMDIWKKATYSASGNRFTTRKMPSVEDVFRGMARDAGFKDKAIEFYIRYIK